MNELKVEKICYACGAILLQEPYSIIEDKACFSYDVICPCCGIHYGYDDGGAGFIISDELTYSDWKFADKTHVKIMKIWRKHWIDHGMEWKHDPYSEFDPKPENWNPVEQMKNIPDPFK